MFSDKTRFWVMFDTSTRREYYLDVHNLLALPAGATLRYQYRDSLLSDAAKVAAQDPKTAPASVLLVYGQGKQYVKGDIQKQDPPFEEMLWIPTRIAEMQLMPSEGANFYFDLKVLGYPAVEPAVLTNILTPLAAGGDVPFKKWVVLSNNLAALESLRKGKDATNWQTIVDELGKPPSQFAGDSFFRLTGPYRGATGRLVTPTYIEEKQTTEKTVEVRKVGASYDIYENERFSVEVISASPPPSSARKEVLVRTLDVRIEEKGPIENESAKALDLRQYNSERLKFRAKRYEELDERAAILGFSAGNHSDGWPLGAAFDQNYRIQKRPAKILLALFTGTLAATLLLVVAKLWDKDPVVSIILGFIAILLVVTTLLLLTGKLGFKL